MNHITLVLLLRHEKSATFHQLQILRTLKNPNIRKTTFIYFVRLNLINRLKLVLKSAIYFSLIEYKFANMFNIAIAFFLQSNTSILLTKLLTSVVNDRKVIMYFNSFIKNACTYTSLLRIFNECSVVDCSFLLYSDHLSSPLNLRLLLIFCKSHSWINAHFRQFQTIKKVQPVLTFVTWMSVLPQLVRELNF